MKDFISIIQLIFAGLGGWLGYFIGGWDGLVYALVAVITIDYITGVMVAITYHKLSSEVGFHGIFKKILILLLVGLSNVLDMYIIGKGSVIRTAVIFYYVSNEGISILENAARLGLPVPAKLQVVLEQLQEKGAHKE